MKYLIYLIFIYLCQTSQCLLFAVQLTDQEYRTECQKVFDRMLLASDCRKILQLSITNDHKLTVHALKPNQVVISRSAIEFCYKNVDQLVGESRLAFVLGHEIAHFINNDSINISYYQRLAQNSRHFFGKLLDLVEYKADWDSTIFMTIANYHPKLIVNNEDINFFQEWGTHIHSSKNNRFRAEKLVQQMKYIIQYAYIFNIGTRLFQMGRWDDALLFLKQFISVLPFQEAYYNIGSIYFQKAITEKYQEFKFPGLWAANSRIDHLCLKYDKQTSDDLYHKYMDLASLYFEKSYRIDQLYLPGIVFFHASQNLSGHSSQKIILPYESGITDNPALKTNYALASYLADPAGNYTQSMETLTNISQVQPQFYDALYNAGYITYLHQKKEKAKKLWCQYLSIDKTSQYAKKILSFESQLLTQCALNKTINRDNKDCFLFNEIESLPITPCVYGIRKNIADNYKQIMFDDISEEVVYFYTNSTSIVSIRNTIAYIEISPEQDIYLPILQEHCGWPLHQIMTYNNPLRKTWVYENFLLDIVDKKVTKIVYFKRSCK